MDDHHHSRRRHRGRQATKPRTTRATSLGLLLSLLVAATAGAYAPREPLYELSAKDLSTELGQITLPAEWKFHPNDDPAFASRSVDDGDWATTDTRLRSGEHPETWQGLGWFRLRFRVSPSLRQVPLALTMHQFGAAEIYLDGELLYNIGSVDPSPDDFVPQLQRQPYLFQFDDRDEHTLAIRFANFDPLAYERVGKIAGFRVILGTANHEVTRYGENGRSLSGYQAFFTGLFAAFALLHLLFYGFYREALENLYFGLLSGTVAFLVSLFFHSHFTDDPRFFHLYDRGMNIGWLVLCVVALRFVYCIYALPAQRLRWVLVVALALMIPAWWIPKATQPWILLALLLTSVEMVRAVIAANLRNQEGARIVGLGILILATGITISLLANLGLLPESIYTVFLIPFGSVLALILTMSIYLSRRFAQTNHELLTQLRQVRELSAHKLEQERRASRDEVQRQLLEAENRRQAEELEEARQLQLSMLPEALPTLPDLEIAAGMFTATEVGGDYYDFDLAADGTLTFAIGDATGHGMRAGTLVTATKSLFKALNGEAALTEALGSFGRALKRMNLHQLRMALTLARFKDGRLCLAAAGMPPALVHRAASGDVESIDIDGMPLGSLSQFPYRQNELDLHQGDTLLLMSDGFPERLNEHDEMLGYDNVREAFRRAAGAAPQAVIDRLAADGDAWADGQPAADDTTFLVLKVR
ncbi:MAG: SpoIIE family protein phosphatase [Acidobacteriota bacterium]